MTTHYTFKKLFYFIMVTGMVVFACNREIPLHELPAGSVEAWGRDNTGLTHCLALREDGSMVSWGWSHGDHRQIEDVPEGGGFTAISAGVFHGLAIRAAK